jgi:hypothetical protein
MTVNIPPIAPKPLADRGQQSAQRSRVTNGKLLPMTDGRSATARRFKDLVQDISADLGGIDRLSEGQRQLIRRAAMLSAECERQEALSVRGDAEFDCEAYGVMCDRLGRLFGRLGLERIAKPVEMSPMERLEAHRKARREAIIDG